MEIEKVKFKWKQRRKLNVSDACKRYAVYSKIENNKNLQMREGKKGLKIY